MFKGRSKALFIGTLIATAYGIYIISYFAGTMSGGSATDQIGGAIATALVTPHMVCTWIGLIFGWLGFFGKKTWAALVSAILYCVAAVLFFLYAFFLIPSIVLGFVGYANQKKLNTKEVEPQKEIQNTDIQQ